MIKGLVSVQLEYDSSPSPLDLYVMVPRESCLICCLKVEKEIFYFCAFSSLKCYQKFLTALARIESCAYVANYG